MVSKKNGTANKQPDITLSLSETEREILILVKNGFTSPQIAKKRGCSYRTIEKHRSNIIKKLGIKSSQNALIIWIMENLKFFNT